MNDLKLIAAGFVLGVAAGVLFEKSMSVAKFEVIWHHAAHYDPITANFTWNDEQPEKAASK